MALESQKTRITEIQVRMDCNGCVQKIKKALHGIDGISDLYIDFPRQKITLVGWADPEKIVKAIKKTRKSAVICSHTEEPKPPPQPSEQSPEGGAPSTESANPPAEAPPSEAAQPVEPPKEPPKDPPLQNHPAEAKPSPEAVGMTKTQVDQPAKPKDVEEVHVVYHYPPDYRYGPSFCHGYGGQWSYYNPSGTGYRHEPPPPPPNGPGFRHEPPPPLSGSRFRHEPLAPNNSPAFRHEPPPPPCGSRFRHEPPPQTHNPGFKQEPPLPPSSSRLKQEPPQPPYYPEFKQNPPSHQNVSGLRQEPPQPPYYPEFKQNPPSHQNVSGLRQEPPPPPRSSRLKQEPPPPPHSPECKPPPHQNGSGFRQESPQSIYVSHRYSTYKPSPYITGYEFVRSPPRYMHYSRPDPYTEDVYPRTRRYTGYDYVQSYNLPPRYTHHNWQEHYTQDFYHRPGHYSEDYHNGNNSNGNISSMFSEENPNACTIS